MSETPPLHVAEQWVASFAAALGDADRDRLAALFAEDSYWRDLVALTGDIGWRAGAGEIADALLASDARERSTGWRVSQRLSPPRMALRVGREVVEAFLEFQTRVGVGVGVVRIVADDDGARAWVLLTRQVDVAGEPRLRPHARPPGVGYDPAEGRNWSERRADAADYSARDPQVLVVGGGHSGLFIAAHLKRLGIDTLIVDRLAQVGESWRSRYHSLALHNSTDMVQFPYLPFPDSYPEYLPKDQLADWFELYVRAMELTYWTSTTFLGGTYDEATSRWTVRLERDGRELELHPGHVVIATGGVGGSPHIPALPGIDAFAGPVLHTRDFVSGAGYAGRRVLVVGVGSSGHDVAFDLARNGARATMLQRHPTSVVSLESANLSYAAYNDGTPVEEADLLSSTGFIYPLLIRSFQALTLQTNERDSEMLAGLEAAGLRIDDGDHGAGWPLKFFQRGGGYYFDVGAAAKVIDGTIAVLQSDDVDTFTRAGLRMRDGTEPAFDEIVLATGYQNQQAELRQCFGDAVADAVGPVSGFGDDGELRNAWRRTAQPGLWIMVSGFSAARVHSPLVALQIHRQISGCDSRR